MANPSSSKEKLRPVVPKLVELIDSTVYGDLWERPELSKRDRSLATVAALVAMRQTDQLRSHLEKALANGVKGKALAAYNTDVKKARGHKHVVAAMTKSRRIKEATTIHCQQFIHLWS